MSATIVKKEEEKTRPMTRCAKCSKLNYFEHSDPIICKSCGYRLR